jgi:hypothetical protein
MKLLGDWNWYLSDWLAWLPKLEHHASPRSSRFQRRSDNNQPNRQSVPAASSSRGPFVI